MVRGIMHSQALQLFFKAAQALVSLRDVRKYGTFLCADVRKDSFPARSPRLSWNLLRITPSCETPFVACWVPRQQG